MINGLVTGSWDISWSISIMLSGVVQILIATGLQAGGLVVLILVETRGFFSSTKHPDQF